MVINHLLNEMILQVRTPLIIMSPAVLTHTFRSIFFATNKPSSTKPIKEVTDKNHDGLKRTHTVDGQNPANQLGLVGYPIIYRVYTPQVVGNGISEPSTVPSMHSRKPSEDR